MSSKKKKNQHRYNISITGKPCVVCIGAGLEQAHQGASNLSLDSLDLASLGKQPKKKKNKANKKLKEYREEILRLQNEKEHYRQELIKAQDSEARERKEQYLESAFNSLFPKRLRKKMSKKEIKRLKKLFKKEFKAQMNAQGGYFNSSAYPEPEIVHEPPRREDDFDDYEEEVFDEEEPEVEEEPSLVRPLTRNKRKTFNASSYAPHGGKYYLDKNRSIEVSVYTKPNDKEKEILDYLSKHPSATQIELANVMALSRSTIADYTSTLKTKGLLHREGTRRSGRWVVSSY